MAVAVSRRWEQHIRRGASPVTEVDVSIPGQGIVFKNLPVSQGSISFSRENSYRASGSVVVADPELFPTLDDPTILEPYGAEIIIRTGIVYPEGIGDLRAGISASDLARQGAAELVPMGVFPIQTVSGTEAGGKIATVEFYDRGRRLEDFSFISPRDKGGKLIQDVIEEEILDSDPFYPPNIPPVETGVPLPGGLHMPSSGQITTPDASVWDLNSFDIRVDLTLDNWSPAGNNYLVAKYNPVSGGRSYALQIDGTLRLLVSENGNTFEDAYCTTSIPASNGTRLAVRVTFNATNGQVNFYTAPTIDSTWNQLGSTVDIGNNFNLQNTNQPLSIGANSVGGSPIGGGTIHAFEIRDAPNGNILSHIKFYEQTTNVSSFNEDGFTWTVQSGRIVSQEDLTGSVSPVNWQVNFDPELDNFALPTGTILEEDRWQFLEGLAESLGAEIFFDRNGDVTVRPIPGIYGDGEIPEPDWVIDAGEDGLLKDADRSVSRDGVYNGVVVVGSADEDRPQPFALVTDNDPKSLTRWGGPFGKSLLRIERSELTTNDQCERAARAELINITGLQRNLSFEAIGNPAMDPGDIIKIVFPDGSSEIHMLDGFDYDFASMNMSASTRSIQYINPEESF